MGALSGEDIKKLAKLLATTLSFDDLAIFVHASTGDRLFDVFVSKDQPKIPMIVQLLNALEDLGSTEKFLAYVYVNRPGRQDVRAAIIALFPEAVAVPDKSIDLSAQKAGAPQAEAPTNAAAPGLQRNVRPYLAKLDVLVWQDRLMKIERQVCRVELAGDALGTGFLVGPDTVLTNWHVFEVARKAGKVGQLGCRFDYARLPNGQTQPGQLVMLDAAGGIDTSPYSPAEQTANPDNPLPTMEQLDYALLRLASRVGEQQIDGVARGWITLPKAVVPLAADSPILIVQHPEGTPMKLALDTQAVIGLNGNGTRLRYRTNTDPGSSGSPVFTMDWDIVALHHYGDPKWQAPLFNQGVPIELIRQHIEKGGFGNALGA
jgi:V8-like Glu-specific endopeptidase